MNRTFKISMLIVLFHCVLAMRCEVENQNPKEIFYSGKAPAILNNLANPKPIIDPRNQKIENTIEVALIDNGVDYLQENIKNRIAYSTDKELTAIGVGHDFAGDDAFAHPALIDARAFSFGAKAIKHGKIVEPMKNPLKELDRINDVFTELLVKAIDEHPVLKDTLFQKITRKNIHILGAYSLLQQGYDTQMYDYYRENDSLITRSSEYEDAEYLRSKSKFRSLVKKPWSLSVSFGLPKIALGIVMYSSEIDQLLGFPEFYEVLQITLDQVMKSEALEEKLQTYFDYNNGLKRAAGFATSTKKIKQISTLYSYWFAYKFGLSVGPMIGLQTDIEDFCASLPDGVFYKLLDDTITVSEKNSLILNQLSSTIDLFEKIDLFFQSSNLVDDAELQGVKNRLPRYQWYQGQMKENFEDFGLKTFSCSNTNFAENWKNSRYTKYLSQYHSPYLMAGDQASHGTKAASVLLDYSDSALIYPIRISVSDTNRSKREIRTMAVKTMREWNDWLTSDIIFRGIQGILEESIDFEWDSDSIEERKSQVVEVFSKFARVDMINSTKDYVFTDQLRKAIKHVGSKSIKLANISLANQNELQPMRTPNNELNVSEMYAFLKYEFLKFRVGKTIVEDASDTIFVVASGNSGEWLDGHARSALPCDLSSPFFAKYIKPGEILVNNQIKNILCVGSLNPQKEISSFSNLPLTNVPFVLASGENLSVKLSGGRCDAFQRSFQVSEASKWGRYSYMSLYGEEELEAKLNEHLKRDDAEEIIDMRDGWPNALLNIEYRLDCYSNNLDKKWKMTGQGTELSAPLATGILADFLLEGKINKSNLLEKKPAVIIDSFLTSLPTLGGESILKELPILHIKQR